MACIEVIHEHDEEPEGYVHFQVYTRPVARP